MKRKITDHKVQYIKRQQLGEETNMEILLMALLSVSQPRLIPDAVKPEIAMEDESPPRGADRRDGEKQRGSGR